jgi:peptidoglycan hydrolase-like protein with peptidoglycan-binding domain
VPELRLRARKRALILLVAVAAAVAGVLGAATGARAQTGDDPGGTSPGKTPSGSSTNGSSNSTDPSSPTPSSTATRTLRRGMRGADVRALQSSLKALGFFRTRPDGTYGPVTVASVKRYERSHDLTPDGVVDPDEAQQISDDAGSGTTADDGSSSTDTGSTAPASGAKATLNSDGTATAPQGAPKAVQDIVAAGNQIADTPYKYGGGHTDDFQDSGYDCSGSVSFALHGAGLLRAPLDSGEFMSWGQSGPGQWVTIYANADHMYMVVAGLRFDTSGASTSGSRWQSDRRSASGYTVRHPPGL